MSKRNHDLTLAESIFGKQFDTQEEVEEFLKVTKSMHDKRCEEGSEVGLNTKIKKSFLSEVIYELSFDKRIVDFTVDDFSEDFFLVRIYFDNSSLYPRKIIK